MSTRKRLRITASLLLGTLVLTRGVAHAEPAAELITRVATSAQPTPHLTVHFGLEQARGFGSLPAVESLRVKADLGSLEPDGTAPIASGSFVAPGIDVIEWGLVRGRVEVYRRGGPGSSRLEALATPRYGGFVRPFLFPLTLTRTGPSSDELAMRLPRLDDDHYSISELTLHFHPMLRPPPCSAARRSEASAEGTFYGGFTLLPRPVEVACEGAG
jgi:hypothetical protein